jgi:hypothetical protein
MSRQAYRLERQLPAILAGAEEWLGTARAAQAVWQFAAALVYGHQYLSLSIVSIVRLSDQNALAARAQDAFARIHDQELEELQRLIR